MPFQGSVKLANIYHGSTSIVYSKVVLFIALMKGKQFFSFLKQIKVYLQFIDNLYFYCLKS